MKYARIENGQLQVKVSDSEQASLLAEGWKPVCESYHEEGWVCHLKEWEKCFVEEWENPNPDGEEWSDGSEVEK